MAEVNEYGQPVGQLLPKKTYATPQPHVMDGRYCRLEPIDPEKHAKDLFEFVYGPTANPANLTYLATVIHQTMDSFVEYLKEIQKSRDPIYFAVINKKLNKAVGTISLLGIVPFDAIAEIGWVTFSDVLQRTEAATEAHYLLACYIMDELEYRRLYWKLDALNVKSHNAAVRLGFTPEGIFRNHRIIKGRSRDTEWLSITDKEWPEIKANIAKWLDPSNFDENGKQKTSLKAKSKL